MRVPVNTEVVCNDGYWGHSTCLIIDPATRDVTHFVVQERKLLDNSRLVPVALIADAKPTSITLNCTKEELDHLPSFIRKHFVASEIPQYDTPGDHETYLEWPLVTYRTVEHIEEHIPAGELAFHKGAAVEAIDGHVGEVNEFIIETGTQHIIHIVLEENHLFGKQHVIIPVANIQRIEKECLYLSLTKNEIKHLPHHQHTI